MTIPRRTFLRDAFRTTLTAGLLVAAARAGFSQKSTDPIVPLEAQKDPVFLFAVSTFEPYVGDIFTAPNSRGENIELKLVKLQEFQATNRVTRLARTSKSFSLQFQASAELPRLLRSIRLATHDSANLIYS